MATQVKEHQIDELRRALNQYLDDYIRHKSKEDMSGREELIVEAGESLLLNLLKEKHNHRDEGKAARKMAQLMASFRALSQNGDFDFVED